MTPELLTLVREALNLPVLVPRSYTVPEDGVYLVLAKNHQGITKEYTHTLNAGTTIHLQVEGSMYVTRIGPKP